MLKNEPCLLAENIRLSFGLRTVLDIDRFAVTDGDRIGLVGENGAGKTTLLRVLTGESAPDTGFVRALVPFAYIRQMDSDADKGEITQTRIAGEMQARDETGTLSGGERTRRRIAAAFSKPSRLLFADEPTSDLDGKGVALLEKYLRAYDGAIVLVSHDRALLDGICNKIAELEDGHLTIYPGNYSAYRAEKKRRRDFQQFEYDQYRAEQSRLRASIQNLAESASSVALPSRMGNSEARLHKRETTATQGKLHQSRKALGTRLEHLQEKERPRDDPAIRMRLGAHTPVTSKTAMEMRGMTIFFPERGVLLENAQMRLVTGSRTALLGDNGCGKTTLLRRILARDARVRINPGVKIGLFGQDHETLLDMEKTALDNVLYDSVFPESEVRTILARLNLRGDNVFKRASVLSGGERAKIALAKLFVSDINVLILDEPTNHIDVFTMEALQEVLASYEGTVLFVSHDRFFTQHVATRLVFFENRSLATFEGTMEQYTNRNTDSDRSEEDRRMEITSMEMRMAQLAARMAQPKKGDSPEQLLSEYDACVQKLTSLKRGMSAK